jgi:hypothetical protein
MDGCWLVRGGGAFPAPAVGARDLDAVAETGVEHVVSLNCRKGKPKVAERGDSHWGGVIEPVTSQLIVDLFSARAMSCRAGTTPAASERGRAGGAE